MDTQNDQSYEHCPAQSKYRTVKRVTMNLCGYIKIMSQYHYMCIVIINKCSVIVAPMPIIIMPIYVDRHLMGYAASRRPQYSPEVAVNKTGSGQRKCVQHFYPNTGAYASVIYAAA